MSVKTCPITPEEYLEKFDACFIQADKLGTVIRRAKFLLLFKDSHYKPIGDACHVPWWVPALIHNQEAGSDVGVFKACLHNGERIIGTGKKTTLVPRGKGPFSSFVEAGIDAIHGNSNKDWSVGGALLFFEKYNGLGYRNHGVASPYVWAMTDQYTKGHYAGDGNWRPDEVSQNYGVAAILKELLLMNEVTLSQDPTPEVKSSEPVNPAYVEAKKYQGQGESNSKFVAFMSGFWAKLGIHYKTIIGSSFAWCGLFIFAMNTQVGQKAISGAASARSWAHYGVEIDWKANGIPRGAVVHINHSANCSSASSNHVAFSDGDCAASDVTKAGATINLFGGNQSNSVRVSSFPAKDICEVRWPSELPKPQKVEKSDGCTGKAGSVESTR